MLLLGASIAMAQECSSHPAASPTPIAIARRAEAERVVVTGGAIERSETDKAQSVTILSEDNLKLQTAADVGRHAGDATRRWRERFHCGGKSSGHSRPG